MVLYTCLLCKKEFTKKDNFIKHTLKKKKLCKIISNETKDKDEKSLGLESKAYLKNAIESAKTVVIKTEKMDSSEKYGRILGWVFLDGSDVSINQRMIDDGYAWGYMGDTKVKDFEALSKKRAKAKK